MPSTKSVILHPNGRGRGDRWNIIGALVAGMYLLVLPVVYSNLIHLKPCMVKTCQKAPNGAHYLPITLR